jgi:hypothetical protein
MDRHGIWAFRRDEDWNSSAGREIVEGSAPVNELRTCEFHTRSLVFDRISTTNSQVLSISKTSFVSRYGERIPRR